MIRRSMFLIVSFCVAATAWAEVPPAGHPSDDSKCGACHSVNGWSEVKFAHEKTGFALEGAHEGESCKKCHPSGLEVKVSRECGGCHRDVHQGDFGMRCGSCHDQESWRTAFTADSHRRTGFPLSGRHASIPCEECHVDARTRGYSRAAVACVSCHLRDYTRASATSIDHSALGFSTSCKECHDSWRFDRARMPAHECFEIETGPHGGRKCRDCHTSLRGAKADGSCDTNTASCTRCHGCGKTDGEHRGVRGYQCKDRKCYECHRFSSGELDLRGWMK